MAVITSISFAPLAGATCQELVLRAPAAFDLLPNSLVRENFVQTKYQMDDLASALGLSLQNIRIDDLVTGETPMFYARQGLVKTPLSSSSVDVETRLSTFIHEYAHALIETYMVRESVKWKSPVPHQRLWMETKDRKLYEQSVVRANRMVAAYHELVADLIVASFTGRPEAMVKAALATDTNLEAEDLLSISWRYLNLKFTETRLAHWRLTLPPAQKVNGGYEYDLFAPTRVWTGDLFLSLARDPEKRSTGIEKLLKVAKISFEKRIGAYLSDAANMDPLEWNRDLSYQIRQSLENE